MAFKWTFKSKWLALQVHNLAVNRYTMVFYLCSTFSLSIFGAWQIWFIYFLEVLHVPQFLILNVFTIINMRIIISTFIFLD